MVRNPEPLAAKPSPQRPMTPAHRSSVRSHLLDWYDANKRDLPWRKTSDPYKIWLSEIMLQQTRVDTVIPYYQKFLVAFPTVHALAKADIDTVLTHWAGLGYYRRARHLHEGAKYIVALGTFPRSRDELRKVPGIGRYTAGAISSIAWQAREPLVDGNVQRVFSRLFRLEGDLSKGPAHELVWAYAKELVPDERPGDFNQAVMELGATVCTLDPRCEVCPLAKRCEAKEHDVISLYPHAIKKAKVQAWDRTALIFRKGSSVLLGKRKDTGVFAGLWEPPQWDKGAPETKNLKGKALGSVDHVLTHRLIHVKLLESPLDPRLLPSTDYTSMRLFAPGELGSIAMSTLAKKILAHLVKTGPKTLRASKTAAKKPAKALRR